MNHSVTRVSARWALQYAPATLAPLRIADYRRLWSSNLLWWIAAFMETLVIGWLVLDMTDSPWLVSVMGFLRSAPLLLFGMMTGPIIDRFGRRKVILGSQLLYGLMYVVTILLLLTDSLALWHLGILAFMMGIAWCLDWPSRRALLPDLVGKERTVDAMLLENLAQGTSRVVGPSLAGILLGLIGPLGCFCVMATLSALSFANLLHLSRQPIPRTSMRPSPSPWTTLAQSLRYARRSHAVLGVLIMTAVMNFFIVPYMTLLPVFARDYLQQGPAGLGILGAAPGLGVFLGLYLINRARRYVSHGWILMAGTFSMCMVLFVFSQSTVYALSWVMLFLAGIGQACFGIMQSSIILLSASDEMRSRTMGMVVAAIGADPLGKLYTGALATTLGAPTALSLQVSMAALVIVVVGVMLPGLRERIEPSSPAPAATASD
jgi:MFS family permease